MNIAFCYESVLPIRGGCETYIADLAHRLVADGHDVHLYARQWDAERLPSGMSYHALPPRRGPRFLRPWHFASECLRALRSARHDVSIGFDKTWGQDVLYPQGGLYAAATDFSLHKYPPGLRRKLASLTRWLDPGRWSFTRLERRQYLSKPRPQIIVNSNMVRGHFQQYYGIPPEEIHVVRAAIRPERFPQHDRLKRRAAWREQHGLPSSDTVGLFLARNYYLKGLEPLLHAVKQLRTLNRAPFHLVVAGSQKLRWCERLAHKLGIADCIHFFGDCPDVASAYFAADFLVHPTFYDPCSLVVLEALACGLPVITTRINGASELLGPLREGYVVDDPHDHARLAWCMSQLLDSQRRAACAQAARKTAQHWTFEQHYQQMLGIFQSVAARKNAA